MTDKNAVIPYLVCDLTHAREYEPAAAIGVIWEALEMGVTQFQIRESGPRRLVCLDIDWSGKPWPQGVVSDGYQDGLGCIRLHPRADGTGHMASARTIWSEFLHDEETAARLEAEEATKPRPCTCGTGPVSGPHSVTCQYRG